MLPDLEGKGDKDRKDILHKTWSIILTKDEFDSKIKVEGLYQSI